jgi:uncharacterized protein YjiS (DUF1127 family)
MRERRRFRLPAPASSKSAAITPRSYQGLLSQNEQQVSVYQCRMEQFRDESNLTTETTPQTLARSFAIQITMEPFMGILSLARYFRRRRTYRSVLQQLSGYSDHELHGIGIDRVDIHEIARQMSEDQR